MIAITALFLVFLAYAQAYRTGAPSAACANIAPQHSGSSLSNSPYSLNVSQLTTAGYTPGMTYTLILTGGASQYKGLLVQGRRGTNPVGSFAAGNLVQPACSDTAVTHKDNSLKNNVPLIWTAPAAGTGSVVFSYAVVVQNSGGVSTYYATLTSPEIKELVVAVSSTNGSALSSISPTSAVVIVGTSTLPATLVSSTNYSSATPVGTSTSPATQVSSTNSSATPATTPATVGNQACPVAQTSMASLMLLALLGIFAVHRIVAY